MLVACKSFQSFKYLLAYLFLSVQLNRRNNIDCIEGWMYFVFRITIWCLFCSCMWKPKEHSVYFLEFQRYLLRITTEMLFLFSMDLNFLICNVDFSLSCLKSTMRSGHVICHKKNHKFSSFYLRNTESNYGALIIKE